MSILPDPVDQNRVNPEEAYDRAKTAADIRYDKAMTAAHHMRGSHVRAAARKAASERLNADYADAQLVCLYWDNPIVNTAVDALEAFGDNLSRSTAQRLLQFWRHVGALSMTERQAVLARFPADDDQDDDEQDQPYRALPGGPGLSGPGAPAGGER